MFQGIVLGIVVILGLLSKIWSSNTWGHAFDTCTVVIYYFRVEGTEFMVTCLADSTCEFGMIKRKVQAVAEYLQEPLKCVAQ